jgi:hypothetical protein
MVIDIIFVGAAILCAVLLVTGKPLNVTVKHIHVVEDQSVAVPDEPEEHLAPTASDNIKNLPEFLQDILGVADEG